VALHSLPAEAGRRFDLAAAVAEARARVATEPLADVDAVLRGTRNVAIAEVGPIRIPVRAISETERAACIASARDIEHLDGIEGGNAWQRHTLALAALDPSLLRSGRRVALYTPDEIGELTASVTSAFVAAFAEASSLARPTFDDQDAVEAFAAELRQHAQRADRARAQHISAAEYFGVPTDQITYWQTYYFGALSA
jgi:hypothetical protein